MRTLEPFQRVAERHAADVWRFCASQVGPERADDCFQETMLAALRAYPELRDPGAVRAWLVRIAARKALDARRAAARAPLPQAEVDPPGTEHEPGPPPGGGWVAQVRALPEKQRLAVAYRVVGDLPYREIAALMDTSQDAARQNVRAGLAALRRRVPHPEESA